MAVDIAHVMVQQHVSRARRLHAERRADDAAAGEVRLDHVILEILVQVIRDAEHVEAQRVVDRLFAELAELAAQVQQFLEVARGERGRVRRRAQQHRADEAALTHGVARIAQVRVGIARAEARDLAALDVLVDVAAEHVAIACEGDSAAIGHDLQSMPREVESAEDLRPQQAADVGAVRVDPVLVQLAAHGRAADPRVAF